jgi:magnesium chelatase subunit D
MLELISQICVDMGVDGHRADITMMKTSITLAAFNGRAEVLEEDVKEAAELVLPHRMRRKPFDNHPDKQDKLDESIEKQREKQREKEKNKSEPQKKEHNEHSGKPQVQPEEQMSDNPQDSTGEQPNASSETIFATGESYQIKQLAPDFRRNNRNGSGRRSKTLTSSKKGRYIKSKIPEEKTTDLAFDATLRAAAPYQLIREKRKLHSNSRLGFQAKSP